MRDPQKINQTTYDLSKLLSKETTIKGNEINTFVDITALQCSLQHSHMAKREN